VVNKEIILQALNIQPGQTILDAGCGNGYMAKIFSEKVTPTGKVYALDNDADAIEVLRKETREAISKRWWATLPSRFGSIMHLLI
jgi:tRNA A58 N-methylase Trm61